MQPAPRSPARDEVPSEGSGVASADPGAALASQRRLLHCSDLPRGWVTWLPALVLLALALTLRLWGLGAIHELIFDETYYVKDGYTLWQEGVEMQWPDEANPAFEAGAVDTYLPAGERVVHPSLGKWIIGAGMSALGADSAVGWRISVALAGSLNVLMTVRIARRLLRSGSMGAIAGGLLAIDGLHLVMSRTSLLDTVLMVFVLAAFGALLIDRDQHRERLARISAAALTGAVAADAGRSWRPWRLLAGVLLGMACSVKWSGLYVLAVFGIMTVLWDWWARRTVREPRWALKGLTRDAIPAFFAMVPTAIAVYIASWTGWLVTDKGYFRDWARTHGHEGDSPVIDGLRSLWEYHRDSYAFHVSLSDPHPYAASPLGWLLQLRPTNFYYRDFDFGEAGCRVEQCSAQVLSVGNPLIWWLGTAAIAVAVFAGIRWRDGRAWAILAGIAAGYLPWLLYLDRTVFTFYSIVFEPWLVMCLAYAIGLALGPAGSPSSARRPAVLAVGALLVLIVLVSAFFWPIWTGQVIDHEQWQWRMWLPSWP